MRERRMTPLAQLTIVLLCGVVLKQFYSTASVNDLRWILAPTTFIVEFATGSRFSFESYAGYINSDRSFIIAASCAGINFLLTAFLLLALGRLWRNRTRILSWTFIPVSAFTAYVFAVVTNAVRIVTALVLLAWSSQLTWPTPEQVHRADGIVVYFGFLLLLFFLDQKFDVGGRFRVRNRGGETHRLFSKLSFPLVVYYGTMVGIPLVTATYRSRLAATDLWQHLVVVLILPLIFILPLGVVRSLRQRRRLKELSRTSRGTLCHEVRRHRGSGRSVPS